MPDRTPRSGNTPHSFKDLVILGEHGAEVGQWLSCLPTTFSYRYVTRPTFFSRAAARARCLVAEVADLSDWNGLRTLKQLPRDPLITPLVVITDPDVENLCSVKDIVCTEIVWSTESPRVVAEAITEVLAQARVVGSLHWSEDLDGRVRRIVSLVTETTPPISSVQRLADLVGLDRRTLWAEWREVFGEGFMPLSDLLRWIMLIRAVPMRQSGMSWRAVGKAIGVHEDTLFRIGRRFLDKTPRELAASRPTEIAAELHARLTSPDGPIAASQDELR